MQEQTDAPTVSSNQADLQDISPSTSQPQNALGDSTESAIAPASSQNLVTASTSTSAQGAAPSQAAQLASTTGSIKTAGPTKAAKAASQVATSHLSDFEAPTAPTANVGSLSASLVVSETKVESAPVENKVSPAASVGAAFKAPSAADPGYDSLVSPVETMRPSYEIAIEEATGSAFPIDAQPDEFSDPSTTPHNPIVAPSSEALASPNFHYYLPLHDLASSYLPAERMAEIDKAFVLADKAHAPQKRASGEPYIIHPIAVATIIAQMHLDTESVVAALLHDTVEDTCVSSEDIQREFGNTVQELVAGVTKLDKLRFHDYREAQAENFRKMILAMTKDIRVILIKLADRTHNMRTLGSLRPDKRKRIARETLDIFAPIANRLGISDIKVELEELGLAALYPMRYRVLKAAVTKARNNRKEVINNILESIRRRLNEVHIKARVLGREKRIYSIYKKMVKKELQFREIMDVYAFRIILDDVDTCYRVLGQMHNLYKPRPSGFKDYIAIPKINGYQSLHTSLVGPHGLPIEIQIRTEYMDQMSARGVAAHWSYKENGSEPTSTTAQKNAQQWIKNIIDLQQSASNSMEFIEGVKTDLFPDSIFVFTPDGKIFDLPAGSTPVDFAYALHTDIGQHCIGARVNHRMYPLGRPLQSGQSVEIITSQSAQPSAIWLSSVVTPRARSKIRQYLKSLKSQECVLIGRRLLQNVLKDVRIDSIPPEQLDAILKEFKEPDLEHLLIEIALGNILAVVVARRISNNSVDEDAGKPIVGTGGLPYSFAQCCLPIPGDPIIGHITTKGLVIHNSLCSNVRDAKRDTDKFMQVDWDMSAAANMDFQTGLRVEIENRQGILSEISNAIDIAGSQINAINSEVKDDGTYLINLTVSVRDRIHLASIIRRIKAVPNVTRIFRRR